MKDEKFRQMLLDALVQDDDIHTVVWSIAQTDPTTMPPNDDDPFLPDEEELLDQCMLWASRQRDFDNIIVCDEWPDDHCHRHAIIDRKRQIVYRFAGGDMYGVAYNPRDDHADTMLKALLRGTPTPRQQKMRDALDGLRSGFGKHPDNSVWQRVKVFGQDFPLRRLYESIRDLLARWGHLAAYDENFQLLCERFEQMVQVSSSMSWEPGPTEAGPDSNAEQSTPAKSAV